MANTLIQIKRSTSTSKPADGTLSAGEQAYSYSSNVLFIGSSAGSEVLAVGGKFYVDRTNSALEIATAAFGAANSAGSSEALADIFNQANAAFDKANSANVLAFNSGQIATASYIFANSAHLTANVSFDKANTAETIAIAAFAEANTAEIIGIAAFGRANTAQTIGIAAFTKANTAETIAIAAFANSNTKFSSSGGSITGDVAITGNLTVTGNVFSQDTTTLRVDDPLIYLAANNFTSDIVDIGFIGSYPNATGSNVFTGLYREHEDKQYYLFQDYDRIPVDNHLGAFSNNMTLAVLNADIKTSNLVLGGQNTITWITAAFNEANLAETIAIAGFNFANSANIVASNAFNKANAANVLAFNTGVGANAFASATIAGANAAVGTGANTVGIAAFFRANTAETIGIAAFGKANAVNIIASGAFDKANSANIVGSSAFNFANSANIIASGAFDRANTANVNAANASFLSTGIVGVGFGGTGVTSFTSNGILYGNTGGPLRVTSAGTEGQVLQAGSTGVPAFGMLDGGNF